MDVDVMALNTAVKQESHFVERMLVEVRKIIVGQKEMIEGIVMGLLAGGHILLEGVPGLAKTLSISSISRAISLDFQRVQFTPGSFAIRSYWNHDFQSQNRGVHSKKGTCFYKYSSGR